jgi:uncharacterized membrane protein
MEDQTATTVQALESAFELMGIAASMFGTAVLAGGFVVVTLYSVYYLMRTGDLRASYDRYRQGLGRTILLGLEILIIADVIETVAFNPTLEDLAVLVIIVLVRTFLGWTLEVELDGVWPWQRYRVRERRDVQEAIESMDATRIERPG